MYLAEVSFLIYIANGFNAQTTNNLGTLYTSYDGTLL